MRGHTLYRDHAPSWRRRRLIREVKITLILLGSFWIAAMWLVMACLDPAHFWIFG